MRRVTMKNPKEVSRALRSSAHRRLFVFCVVILLFVQLECRSFCAGPASSYFERHPIDAYTKEGGNATFTCTVLQFDPNTETLTWHVIPDEYPAIISDYYDESSQNKTSVITVSNIGRNEHSFKCVLRGLYEGHVLGTCLSRTSTLHVLYFPRKDEISCGPRSLGELQEGSLLSLWCMVRKGSPSVNLSWKINRLNTSLNESHLSTKGQKLILNQEVYLGHELHSEIIYCVASSNTKIFPNQNISCSIGPLLIRHKPQVRIYPSEILTKADNNARKLRLNCVATSYPEDKFFRWFCSPKNVLLGCNTETSETILSTKEGNTTIADINFVVSCSVTNAEGTTTAVFVRSLENIDVPNSSNIKSSIISGANPSFSLFCQNATLQLNLFNNSMDWEMFSFEINMICFLDCFETDDTYDSVSWFVNGSKIEDGRNTKISHSFPPLTSYLTVKRIFREYEIMTVTCEIQSEYGTYEKSMNLSFFQPRNTTFYVNEQIIHHLADGISKTKSGDFVSQSENATSTSHIGHFNVDFSWFQLSGIQVVVLSAVAVLGGLLLTACICAFCTVCLFKYWQRTNFINTSRCHGTELSATSVSCHASQQNTCLSQRDKSVSKGDVLYEEPISPPPPPRPVRSANVHCKENYPKEENHVFSMQSSEDLSVSYHSHDSVRSTFSSDNCSDTSISSECSGGSTPGSNFHETFDLCDTLPEHNYDNA